MARYVKRDGQWLDAISGAHLVTNRWDMSRYRNVRYDPSIAPLAFLGVLLIFAGAIYLAYSFPDLRSCLVMDDTQPGLPVIKPRS